jgi:hypothetical protein
MSNIPAPSHGVMEAKGAYNRRPKLPAGGAALAAFGEGSSKRRARPERTAYRHRGSWIVSGETLDGPYAVGYRRPATPHRPKSRDLCVWRVGWRRPTHSCKPLFSARPNGTNDERSRSATPRDCNRLSRIMGDKIGMKNADGFNPQTHF